MLPSIAEGSTTVFNLYDLLIFLSDIVVGAILGDDVYPHISTGSGFGGLFDFSFLLEEDFGFFVAFLGIITFSVAVVIDVKDGNGVSTLIKEGDGVVIVCIMDGLDVIVGFFEGARVLLLITEGDAVVTVCIMD